LLAPIAPLDHPSSGSVWSPAITGQTEDIPHPADRTAAPFRQRKQCAIQSPKISVTCAARLRRTRSRRPRCRPARGWRI